MGFSLRTAPSSRHSPHPPSPRCARRVGQRAGPDGSQPGQAECPPRRHPPAAALPALHKGAAHRHPPAAAGAGGDTGGCTGRDKDMGCFVGGVDMGRLSTLAGGTAHGARCLGRWMVTPSWMLPRSSSAPARSPQSPVMLARPWMSVGWCLPQNLAVLGLVWPQRAPHSSPAPEVPVSAAALPGAQSFLSQARCGGGGAGGAEPDPAQAAARG